MNADEKRRHPRLPVFSAALVTRDSEGWLSEVRDLSRSGARLARPGNWRPGQAGDFRLWFIFDQETVIGVNACCVREDETDLGFEFLPGEEAAVQAVLYESRFANGDHP